MPTLRDGDKSMSSNEIQSKQIEKTNAQPHQSTTASALHQAVFSSPDEYLTVLKNNFGKLSHGHEQLGLQDLQVDAIDPTLSPQLRAAAALSAKNFSELLNMSNQRYGTDPAGSLDMDSLNFIDDMVNHKIIGHTAERIGADVGGMALSAMAGGAGAFMTGVTFENGVAATIAAEGLGVLGIGALTAGMTVGGVIGVGLFGYGAAVEYSHLNSYANKDSQEIGQWIKR